MLDFKRMGMTIGRSCKRRQFDVQSASVCFLTTALLEHDPEKARPGLDPEREPVFEIMLLKAGWCLIQRRWTGLQRAA